jgi:hypothetical protein
MDTGTFKVFQYNRKDLFLQAPDESFVVRSFDEIPPEVREFLCRDLDNGIKDRQIEIAVNGEIRVILTPAEIETERLRKDRISRLLAGIAAIEASGSDIPQYAKERLATLRKELGELTPIDPTATTLEQQRANDSITRPEYDPRHGRK